MPQPQATFIQTVIADGIRSNPETAAKEVPQILGHYILDNTRLNRVYQAAKVLCRDVSLCNLDALALAVLEAEQEQPTVTFESPGPWDDGPCGYWPGSVSDPRD